MPSSNIIASNAAQARMKKPRPTNDRGSACQTIWYRYAPGIAASMAPFSAKRKGRQSFAPRFVYPPKMQIKQMRGKLLSTSRVSCHRLPSVRLRQDLAALFRPVVSSSCVPAGPWPPGRDPRRPLFIQPSTGKQKETAMFGMHKTQAVKDLAGDLAGDLDAAIGRARDARIDRASGKTRHKLWEPSQSRQSTKNRDCAISTYFFHAQNFLGFVQLIDGHPLPATNGEARGDD